MPRVGAEEERRTLAECQYRYPVETLSDLQSVRSRFSDLRLYVDFYCFPNKEKKKLVYLTGTLPVHYEGSQYNIPVCIWLHETHPVSRPRCYVCPSVSMVINPSCPCVDASGNILLDGLSNWTHGASNLSLLVLDMKRAFQKDTPLYARHPVHAPPPGDVQVSAGSIQSLVITSSSTTSASSITTSSAITSSITCSISSSSSSITTSSSPQRWRPASSHLSEFKASQWEQSREVRSYSDELQGIDFSVPPPPSSFNHNNPFLSSSPCQGPDPLSRRLGALKLDGKSSRELGPSPVWSNQSEAAGAGLTAGFQRVQAAGVDQMAGQLPPDLAAVFLSLMTMEGRSFTPADVMEAVQLNRDFPSALRFLTHSCPICQDQVSFSKVCFKSFFSAAIKERSVEQLVCPQCGRPEVRGQGGLEESMDYFNLLDTQIRHFLPPQIHELFQRKLRDRALQEMDNFCWCAHCSFGMLHEADRLRMDCPSCKKSTCSQCRSPWSPEHQGVSCEQFRAWQQQNDPDPQLHNSLLYNSIECPACQSVFSLSRGGCLHFTCSQCQHQFCGGCSQRFALGAACTFSEDCGTRGLHSHHPRDCLYHLRDWSVTRLHLLLQHYRVSPSWLQPANSSSPDPSLAGACSVLELRDDGSRREEPCGRPALPEHRGYCQMHYKERLVELINRCRADPAVLFSPAEMMAELQRWYVAIPTRNPEEPEPLYAHRLRMTLVNSIPLRKQRRALLRPGDDHCSPPPAVPAGAPPPHLLLSD